MDEAENFLSLIEKHVPSLKDAMKFRDSIFHDLDLKNFHVLSWLL